MSNFKKIIYIDLETTGVDTKKDQILSIGIIATMNGKITYQHNVYLNHNIDIPIGSFKVHGLSRDFLLKNGYNPVKVLNKVYSMLLDADLVVAYNAIFDLDFLHNSFLKFLKKPLVVKNILCPLTVYRDFHAYPHKLIDACSTYGIDIGNAHNSLDDIKATLNLVIKMSKKIPVLEYNNYLGYLKKYPVAKKNSWDKKITYFAQEFQGQQYKNSF